MSGMAGGYKKKWVYTLLLAVIVFTFGLGRAGWAGDPQVGGWQATRLRGLVYVLVEGNWSRLDRDQMVPEGHTVRTAANGHVRLQRADDRLDLGPNTQIRVHEKNAGRYTVVQQDFGDLSVAAQHLAVPHFAVQTPFLAAVVKGTRFNVKVGPDGAQVGVTRGQVEVRDALHGELVQVRTGQRATVSKTESLTIGGRGDLDKVVSYSGSAYSTTEVVVASSDDENGSGNSSSNSSNSNAGGNSSSNANANAGAGNNNAGGNSSSNSSSSNAGGNSSSNASSNNAGGNSSSNSSSSNAGGNSSSNANSNSSSNNAGGNSSSNANANAGAGNNNAGGNSKKSDDEDD